MGVVSNLGEKLCKEEKHTECPVRSGSPPTLEAPFSTNNSPLQPLFFTVSPGQSPS